MTEQEVTYLKVKFPNALFQSLEDLSISPANSSKALDSTRHEYSAKLEAVNFDKVKEDWYQSRFHDQVKSCEKKITISGHEMIALEGDAVLVNQIPWDNNTLYRDLRPTRKQKVRIRLIPYYAWDNRGIQDMSLWLPLAH